MRVAVLMILLPVLLYTSISRNELWRDDGTIWADSIRKSGKARGYNELGIHLLSIGNLDEAYRILTRSLAMDAYQPTVYINLGIALERLDRIQEAINTYEQVIRFQPDEPIPYYNAGVLYYNELHDRKRALSYLLTAKELGPREPDVHLYLGRIYQDLGDSVRSREEFELYQHLKHR